MNSNNSTKPGGPGHTGDPRSASGGFFDLRLARPLQEAVGAVGYQTPTPIQREAIPHVMDGRDVLGCAQTGTGKTAAFALPILNDLLTAPRRNGRPVIRALVLAPTRELAAQIGASFEQYAARTRLRQHVVFGGVNQGPQIRALRRGIDVLVATPGRLLDLMNQGEVAMDHVRTLVLDEADRMLDMGFIHDVRRVVQALPKKRQTLLFSATMPDGIQHLARQILVDPVRVAVDPIASTVEPTTQCVYFVEVRRKTDLLLTLLRGGDIDRALVFTRTKHGANRVAQKLERAGVAAGAIHGNKSQAARERVLDGFKREHLRVVVATDIAARGIDIKGLSHVICFDLPNEPESYVHRVGRTGRAGASGTALAFCAPEERPYLAAIERLTNRRLNRIEAPAGLSANSERYSAPRQQPRSRVATAYGKGVPARSSARDRFGSHRGGPRARNDGPSATPTRRFRRRAPAVRT